MLDDILIFLSNLDIIKNVKHLSLWTTLVM